MVFAKSSRVTRDCQAFEMAFSEGPGGDCIAFCSEEEAFFAKDMMRREERKREEAQGGGGE